MKFHFLTLAALFAFNLTIAQNEPPSIKDISVSIDSINQNIEVTYSLSDQEDQNVEVLFKVSTDNGQTFTVNTDGATGDVGSNITLGNKKKITWNYSNSGISLDKAKWRLVADDYYEIDINDLLAKVDQERLKQRLKQIAIVRNHETEIGKENLELVRSNISGLFTSFGLNVRSQNYEFGGLNGSNIIGALPGQKESKKAFSLLTHYDAVQGSPGANANASGVVGMLEIAEILSQYNTNYSLVTAAVDLGIEEYRGAINYVYSGGIPDDQEVLGAISLDAIGFYNDEPNTHIIRPEYQELIEKTYAEIKSQDSRANFISCISNERSIPLQEIYATAAAKFVPDLRVIYPTTPKYGETTYFFQDSDHATFWYNDLPALYVSDGGLTRNPENNSKDDTVDKLNIDFMTNVIKASLATIAEVIELKHCTIYEESFIRNSSNKATDSERL